MRVDWCTDWKKGIMEDLEMRKGLEECMPVGCSVLMKGCGGLSKSWALVIVA